MLKKLISSKLFKILLGCLGGLVLVLGLAFGALQTQAVKDRLADLISETLSTPEQTVTIEGLRGVLPFQVSVEAVTVNDDQGTLLRIEKAGLAWDPLGLLSGRIKVTSLEARSVLLDHLPAREDKLQPEGSDTAPELPALPPVILDRIEFDRIELGPSVVGAPGVFSFQADLALHSRQSARGSLNLRQTDQPGLHINAQAVLEHSRLQVDLSLQEHPRGFVDSLSGNPLPFPVTLSLQGQGPLSAWEGSLDIASRSKALLTSSMEVSLQEESTSLSVKSRLFAHELLPATIQEVLQPQEAFPVELQVLHESKAGLLKVKTIKVQTSLAELRLSGEVDLQKRAVDARAGVDCPELQALKPLLPVQAQGRALLDVSAQGPWSSPDVTANLAAENLSVSGFTIPGLDLSLSTSLPASLKKEPLAVRGSGRLSALLSNTAPMTSGPVMLELQSSFSPSGSLDVEKLTVSSIHEKIQVSGRLEPDKTFSADMAASVTQLKAQPLLQSAGMSGSLDLDLTLQGDLDPLSVSAGVQAATDNISGLPDQFASLAGSRQELQGHVFLYPDGIVSISPLELRSPQMSINLTGQADTQSDQLDLTAHLKGPDLSRIELASVPGLQGRLSALCSVTGPMSSMQADLDLTIRDLAQAWLKTSDASVKLQARGLPESPAGSLQLSLSRGTAKVSSCLDFSLNNNIIRVDNAKLDAPETQLRAEALWPLQGQQDRTASLNLDAGALSWLETFIPFACQGQVELETRYEIRNATQRIAAQGLARNLRLPWVAIGNSDLNANITDLQQLAGSVRLTGSDIRARNVSLTKLEVTGQGDPSMASFDISTQGRLPKPFAIQTQGSLSTQGSTRTLTLNTGQGSVAQLLFDWDEPVRLQRDAQTLRIQESRINLGRGRLSLEAHIKDMSQVQASIEARNIQVQDIPLNRFKAFSGTLSSDLKLGGTLKAPRVELQASVDGFQARTEAASEIPPVKASITAGYDGRMVKASLQASQADLTTLKSSLSLPGTLALQPFQLTPSGRLDADISGSLDLDRVNRFLPLVGHQFGGKLKLDLQARGPVTTPSISGDFQLSSGSYEQALSGLALTDIRIDGTVRDRTVTIETLKASDGGQGSLSGQGFLEIKPGQGLEYELSTGLDSARLIRLDMAQGSVSGDLKVTGTSNQARITGNLSIFPLEVSLPQPGPPGTSGLIIKDKADLAAQSSTKGQPTKPAKGSFLDKTGLDIGLTLPRGTFVRGRGLDSEWQANLNIQGRASAPKINGRIQNVRGHLNLLTKRFTLTEGSITFTSRFPPQPLLNITASHQAKDIEVIVRVTGPAANPTIKLDSDPALPRDEILSRLLFNRELSTITPLQAVKLALAVRTLTSGGEGFMDKTRSMIGLDELEIRAGGQDEGTTVGVGKYVNENIYFKVEKGLDDQSGLVTVDIEISPRFSLETQAGALNQGVTFKWNYQY